MRHPFPAQDFSSFLLQAQSSGAQVIGLANAGNDTINAIKQAAEFGITPKQSLVGLLMFITDVHSLGLKATQGMYLTTGFYWDLNDETRAWSKRFVWDNRTGMPTMVQAGDYSAVYHYLKAVKAAGTDDTEGRDGEDEGDADQRLLRDERQDPRRRPDGARHVPGPGEKAGRVQGSRGTTTTSGRRSRRTEAFMPLSESICPLVKK